MLRLTTFGGLALSSDGVPMTGAAAQRSRLALLALLASAGPAGISRDKLLFYLWSESDAEHARRALKQAVYALRREVANDDVIVGTATLSLNPAVVTSDLWDFEQALARSDDAAAATTYVGPFLDGVYLKDAMEFERWTAEERARLAHDWCSAIERLAARAEQTGEWREAVAWHRQLAAAEPLGGRVAMALMRSLAESGDVGAALQHFRVHETMVREELDAEPEADVVMLADAMRSGTWERSVPVPRATPVPPVSLAPAAIPGTTTGPAADEPPSAPPAGAPSSAPVRSRIRRRLTIGLAVAAAIIVVVAIAYSQMSNGERPLAKIFPSWSKPPITAGLYVVAPLENMTNDTTLNAFGVLAAETMTKALGLANVAVVPALTGSLTQETMGYVPSAQHPHELGIAVARERGASTAVVGSYYPLKGDTVRVMIQFIDMASGKADASFPTIEGVVKGAVGLIPLADKLGRAMLARMAQAADTTPEGKMVALVPATSYEAVADVSRAYSLFFQTPADTAGVFALLARAEALDPEYTAPLLLRAYVMDVKRLWPGTQTAVQKLHPFATRLNVVERDLLDLYESDLHGEPYGRLAAARKTLQQSSGAPDMALLLTLSALYVGRPEEALAALRAGDPGSGLKLGSPVYWEWRAEAEHEAEQYPAEVISANEGIKRFPTSSSSIRTMARVLATAGDTRLAELRALLETGVPEDSNRQIGRLDLMATTARELRHHGDAAAAAAILTQVAAEGSGLTSTSPRMARYIQASALYDLGRYADARPILTELARTDRTDLAALGRLGAIAVRLQDRTEAARIDAELAAVNAPYLMGDAIAWRAHMAAADGRIEDAVTLLRAAVKHGYRLMDLSPDTVHLDLDFVALSRSKAYQDLQHELATVSVR